MCSATVPEKYLNFHTVLFENEKNLVGNTVSSENL